MTFTTIAAPCLDRPLFRGPFLHTLQAWIGLIFVPKCSHPNLSSQRAFFYRRSEHKKPDTAPARVGRKSHVLRGEGLGRASPCLGRGVWNDRSADRARPRRLPANRPFQRASPGCLEQLVGRRGGRRPAPAKKVVGRETNWSREGTTGRTREHFIHQRSRPYKLAVEPANPLRPTVPSPLLPPFWSPVLRSRSS